MQQKETDNQTKTHGNSWISVCTIYLYLLCLKENGTLFESMDALFGLPRKKPAGSSVRDPLHGSRFFYNQDEVDKFVQSQDSSGTTVSHLLACLVWLWYSWAFSVCMIAFYICRGATIS